MYQKESEKIKVKNNEMNLTTIKSKIHSRSTNYLIAKCEYNTIHIIYHIENGIELDLFIGALNDILNKLNERKELEEMK